MVSRRWRYARTRSDGIRIQHTARQDDPGDKQLIVVQDLIDHAAVLDEYAEHCASCPANRSGQPYGCMGFVDYPITARAETWLLERLARAR